MRLFLFGTLLWPDLLTLVAGRPVAVRPATLPGHAVARAKGGDWPLLHEAEGSARGVVTEVLDEAALARIDWYEGGYDCHRAPVDGTGKAGVHAYRTPDSGTGPWDLDAWIERHGARTLRAAAEIMRAMDREAPQSLAARRGIIHARAGSAVDVGRYERPQTVGSGLTLDDVTMRATAHPYEGFNAVTELTYDHARFDGSRSGPLRRAVSVVGQAATVLPYDPARDRVLLVEQIRAGALALGDPRPWMLEPVAGLIDAGDTPEATAIREAQEEAGLTLHQDALHKVGRYYPSPGGLAQVLYSYVALCDLPDDASGLGGLDSEAEDIRAHLVDLDTLMAMIDSGEAANAPLILSAQWIALRRAGLRAGTNAPSGG